MFSSAKKAEVRTNHVRAKCAVWVTLHLARIAQVDDRTHPIGIEEVAVRLCEVTEAVRA